MSKSDNGDGLTRGPAGLRLPPPIIGCDPDARWSAIEPLPNEYLASLKMGLLSALGQAAPLEAPVQIELGVLAGILREVEEARKAAAGEAAGEAAADPPTTLIF